MGDIFKQTVGVRVVEGTGNGEQSHVLFGVILDEEVDDIAFSIDHVCGSRSVSFRTSDGRLGNTYDQRGFQKGKNL